LASPNGRGYGVVIDGVEFGRWWLKMLGAVAPGDVATVTRIDRLARSTFDVLDAKAQFGSLAEPWADTGAGHLMIAGLAERDRIFQEHVSRHSPRQRPSRSLVIFGRTAI